MSQQHPVVIEFGAAFRIDSATDVEEQASVIDLCHGLRVDPEAVGKTADRHVQNASAKIGVSTRAAATVFAMQHGLAAWGELPMVDSSAHS
jgi:hypothetical protein